MSTTTAAAILVAEEEEMTRSFLYENLSADGYQVLLAPDRAKALALLSTAQPDLVLVDVNRDTLSLIDALRSGEGIAGRADPDTPVIALGRDADRLQRIRLLDRGSDDVVKKPFAYPELQSRIRGTALSPTVQSSLRRDGVTAPADLSPAPVHRAASRGRSDRDQWRFQKMHSMTDAAGGRGHLFRHERLQLARAEAFSRRAATHWLGVPPVKLSGSDLEVIDCLVRSDRTAVSSALLAVAGIGTGQPVRLAVLHRVRESAHEAYAERAISAKRAAQIARHITEALRRADTCRR